MAKIAFIVNKKSGLNFIDSMLVPARQSGLTRFGLRNGMVIAVFVLLLSAGLVLLLKH